MLKDKNLYNASHGRSLEVFYYYLINVGTLTESSNKAVFYADKDGSPLEPLLYTSSKTPFTHEGLVYTPIKIEHTEMTQDTSGKINDVTLTVGNFGGVLQFYVEEYDICGNEVVVGTVIYDLSDDSVFGSIEEEYRISSVSSSDMNISLVLSSGVDVLKLSIPGRRLYSQLCSWKFGDTDCKYVPGVGEKCSLTWTDCVAKNNTRNFGGAPGILNERFYI